MLITDLTTGQNTKTKTVCLDWFGAQTRFPSPLSDPRTVWRSMLSGNDGSHLALEDLLTMSEEDKVALDAAATSAVPNKMAHKPTKPVVGGLQQVRVDVTLSRLLSQQSHAVHGHAFCVQTQDWSTTSLSPCALASHVVLSPSTSRFVRARIQDSN